MCELDRERLFCAAIGVACGDTMRMHLPKVNEARMRQSGIRDPLPAITHPRISFHSIQATGGFGFSSVFIGVFQRLILPLGFCDGVNEDERRRFAGRSKAS